MPELVHMLIGAALNLAVALIIVRFIYYPVTQDKTYVFTFMAFNTVIYFVLGMLTSSTLSVGVGFGLFAIFSVLRYRTDEMPIREMTYLFIVIALPVMNSIMISGDSFSWLLAANGTIVALLFILEKEWGFHFSGNKRVIYDQVELIGPAERERLIDDLRERTGLPVTSVEVRRIDLLHDTAELTVFYEEPKASKA